MKNTRRKNGAEAPQFRSGQIWQMEGSNLQIGLVGKTLVHYKHYKGQTKRSPISLSGKQALEKFLRENNATLVQE